MVEAGFLPVRAYIFFFKKKKGKKKGKNLVNKFPIERILNLNGSGPLEKFVRIFFRIFLCKFFPILGIFVAPIFRSAHALSICFLKKIKKKIDLFKKSLFFLKKFFLFFQIFFLKKMERPKFISSASGTFEGERPGYLFKRDIFGIGFFSFFF